MKLVEKKKNKKVLGFEFINRNEYFIYNNDLWLKLDVEYAVCINRPDYWDSKQHAKHMTPCYPVTIHAVEYTVKD